MYISILVAPLIRETQAISKYCSYPTAYKDQSNSKDLSNSALNQAEEKRERIYKIE